MYVLIGSDQFAGIAGNHGKDGKLQISENLTKLKVILINMFGKNLTSKNIKNKTFRRFRVFE